MLYSSNDPARLSDRQILLELYHSMGKLQERTAAIPEMKADIDNLETRVNSYEGDVKLAKRIATYVCAPGGIAGFVGLLMKWVTG